MRHLDSDYLDSDYRRPYRENDRHYHDSYNHDRRIRSKSRGPSQRSESLDTTTRTSISRYRSGKEEMYNGDTDSQSSVYKLIKNRVYKLPTSVSDDDIGPHGSIHNNTLAGLIFMSNDKVRVSSFRYNVLGMPLAKKPILDRVEPGTKLFLFEHEARVLWGIYEATSTAGIDIEKNIYRGSPVPFPAQVKFRVYRYCRPLPEKVFRPVIEDNYFTPSKFNFELSESQVSDLLDLFDQREAERLRMNVRDRSSGRNDYFKSLPATTSQDIRTSNRHKEENNSPLSAREHSIDEMFRNQISDNDNLYKGGYATCERVLHKKIDGPITESLSLLAANTGSVSKSAKPRIGDVRNINIDLNSTLPTEDDMECETRYPEKTDISKEDSTRQLMVDYFNSPKTDAAKSVKGIRNLLHPQEDACMLEMCRRNDSSIPSNNCALEQAETVTCLKLNSSYVESVQNSNWATTDQDVEPNMTIGLSLMANPSEARKTHNFFPILDNYHTVAAPEEYLSSDKTAVLQDDYSASEVNMSSPYKGDGAYLATEKTLFTRISTLEENVSCTAEATAHMSTHYGKEETTVRKDSTDCIFKNSSRKRNANDDAVQPVGVKKQASNSSQAESDEEWLEKARSAVINSVISRSNKNVECSPKGGPASSDPVQRSVSKSLEKRLNFPSVSNSPGRSDNAESGRSVWSRLSAPKSSSLNRHLSFSKGLTAPSEYSDDACMTRTRKRNM